MLSFFTIEKRMLSYLFGGFAYRRQPAFSWRWPWRSSKLEVGAAPASLKLPGSNGDSAHANSNTSCGTLIDASNGAPQV